MKNLLLTIILMTPLVAIAQDDQTIMFEFGIGIGNASGGRTDGNDKAKFCKNRNTDRMMFGAIRYSYNDIEAHVAKWWHDEDTRCNRDSMAVGVGYVIDSQGNGTQGTDDVYVSWTPGLAYTWGEDKDFTGQDDSNTNWRQTGNWQVFNRVAVGAGGNDGAVELAVHRYGTFNPEHGEYFVTVGAQLRDLEDTGNTDGDRGLTPPESDSFEIIVKENTESTTPSKTFDTSDQPGATEIFGG